MPRTIRRQKRTATQYWLNVNLRDAEKTAPDGRKYGASLPDCQLAEQRKSPKLERRKKPSSQCKKNNSSHWEIVSGDCCFVFSESVDLRWSPDAGIKMPAWSGCPDAYSPSGVVHRKLRANFFLTATSTSKYDALSEMSCKVPLPFRNSRQEISQGRNLP